MGVAPVALSTTAAPAQTAAQAAEQTAAQAPANAEPTYQVKLLVDPCRVLDRDGAPLGAAAAVLALGSSSGFELTQYMDDDRLSLAAQDWIIRIRRGGEENRLCLTYKRRFGIDGDGTDPAAVRRALDRASAANFDAGDTNYEPQVNLSYSRATLDFCNKKREPVPYLDPGELPGPEASRALTRDRLPGKLRKWATQPAGWAESVAAHCLVHGPVRQTNYPGRLLGHRLEMQVTPLRGACGERTWFTEITAKAATLGEAVALRAELLGRLRAEGWLLEREAFKTDLILAAP
ncbi:MULTISPECIES: hypothetical protein [unclassified Streptomyces]|uniref:hypothetical protein n=1 Tax=unclassified Streptomyces TaxID=2593676 RepID=UPI001BECE666|nr:MULTISPECIES: hypothetical protein [unclassified Streptomyces]MBT2403168.1 hypothetical protein [Streptomyces sp. ISL-21]MBT2457529.1 hypothetical protein [Streptomyces sp. ISL-86]MBT2610155.1 hypothetical protein [Streptomyces sp. ISL-87]